MWACALAFNVPLANASKAQEFCNKGQITVVASTDEGHDACAAVGEVLQYFAAGGLHLDLTLTIRFQSSVFVEIAGGASPPTAIPVLGRFNQRKGEIQIFALSPSSKNERRPWGLPRTAEIASSILRHEVAHAVIAKLLAEKYDKLPPAWHEALAYIVQFELMSTELRGLVLAAYPRAEPFDQTSKINDLTYGFDPDGFGVRVYLTYMANGRMSFLKKALAFERDMIDLRDYFY